MAMMRKGSRKLCYRVNKCHTNHIISYRAQSETGAMPGGSEGRKARTVSRRVIVGSYAMNLAGYKIDMVVVESSTSQHGTMWMEGSTCDWR